jgi:hypothetical protein
MSVENHIATLETPLFDLSFIYNAPHYDELSEYLKKAKVFKKLESLSAEAHKAAVKAAVAEILILIRMTNEFPEESRKRLSSADKGAAKYFSKFTADRIEEIIEKHGLLTPLGLKVAAENAETERERKKRYQSFKARICTEDEEFVMRLKNEVREEIENEVMSEKLEEWSQIDAARIRKMLESSDPELSEKLTEIVKEEIREELSVETEKIIDQCKQDGRSKVAEIIAHPQDGIEETIKELRETAELTLNKLGCVRIGDIVREGINTCKFDTVSTRYIIIDNIARYLKKKYDLVLSLAPKDRDQSVYVKFEYATHAQIREDVENKATLIVADLRKFNRYCKQYTGKSTLVSALRGLSEAANKFLTA